MDRNSPEYLANLPKSLDTVKEHIRQILIHVPSARSNDKILIIEYLKSYSPAFAYDPSTKLINFRNPAGITYEQFLKLQNFESISRLRRFLQAEAKERITAGTATEEDAELLPSDKVAEQRRLREEESRLYYVRN